MLKALFLVSSADDKGGMGGPAEKRTRRKRTKTAGEARQRGETGSRKIKTKIYILFYLMIRFYTMHPKVKTQLATKCLFFLLCTWFSLNLSLTEWHKQPSYSLTEIHSKRKTLTTPSALTTRMYLLLCITSVCEIAPEDSKTIFASCQLCISVFKLVLTQISDVLQYVDVFIFSPAVFLHHL